MKLGKNVPQMNILLIYLLEITAVWTYNDTVCIGEKQTNCSVHCENYYLLEWLITHCDNITDNSMIVFLPGTHYLNSNDRYKALIRFDRKYNLTLTGYSPCGGKSGQKKERSIVVCGGDQSGFLFSNSRNVSITNLEFQGCGADMNLIARDNSLFYGGVFFHLSYYITISQVCIRDSKGYGLHMDNVCGSILIEHSKFVANENGNVVLWFRHCANYNETNTTTVKIHNTEFRDGFTNHQNATGLYLLLKQRHTKVILTHLIFSNNTGIHGGNMNIRFVDFAENTGCVHIENTSIMKGHGINSGGGMLVYLEQNAAGSSELNDCNSSNNQNSILSVKNTIISYNKAKSGGGVHLAYYEKLGFGCTTRLMKITNCTLSYNNALRGSALEIIKHNLPKHELHYVPQLFIIITDCHFVENTLSPKKEQYNEEGIVEGFEVDSIVIQNTTFKNNRGTALMLVNSGVQFKGKVIFKENSARYGGAMKICGSSQMYLKNETRVQFLNNSADLAGGAIHASTSCLSETPPCFFQILQYNETIVDFAQDILYFEGNHAGIAGHAIYGGLVDYCFTDHSLHFNRTTKESYYYSYQLFNHIFKFSDTTEPSKVTSDPYGVCLCTENNRPMCENRTYDIGEKYPGEDFSIFLTAVGQTNDTVPARIDIESSSTVTVQKMQQYINESTAFCRNMTMNLEHTQNDSKNVNFYVEVSKSNLVSESSNYYKIPKLIVNATLKPCPFLFELRKNKCDCPKIFDKIRHIKCSINSKTVIVTQSNNNKHPNRRIWISCDYNSTTGKCKKYQGSENCQKNHCRNRNISYYNQTTLSSICNEGREGRLCSKCCSNYTLFLGSSKCKTNEYCPLWSSFLLILAFGIFGVLLVCFVTLFNFTVAEGTVHGLLLYANCIQVIQYYLFTQDHFPVLVRVFISWLNLDFGIEVCFYAGMTAYQKIWLEFVFLFYLLLLGVMIVCLSHRFVWFTRLAGRNVVPVLATIALFAYPKLVRNSIRVWECHQNYVSSDNNIPYVWYMDETIECFKGKHLALFIVSIPLFFMAFLYMLCLLFIQCLQRRSSWFVLRWVNKLRPFFDAHTGPCHDHYRFWPGFLLFIKMALYIASWRMDSPIYKSYFFSAICMLLFFLACIFPRGVYKSWPLNVLDFSFIFNIGIVSVIVATQNFYYSEIGWISISIAALTFVLIIVYHTFKRVKETRCWKRCVTREKTRKDIYQITESDESTPLIQEQGLPRVVEFTRPREPLLEDD